MLIRKPITYKLIPIVLISCLLLESVNKGIFLLLSAGLYEFSGFGEYTLKPYAILGCLPVVSQPFHFFTVSACMVILFIPALYLTKNATTEFGLYAGAIFMYPFVSGFIMNIFMSLILGRVPFIPYINREIFREIPMELFGNYLNYSVIKFTINMIKMILGIAISWLIIVHYWPTHFRKIIFTIGLVSTIAGYILWYFLLGPIVLS